MTKEKVMSVLKALGPDEHVWIAGSAAICPSRAEDIDIWVEGASKLKPKQFSPELWKDFKGPAYSHLPVTARKEISYIDCSAGPIKIQVMWLHDSTSIYDLLNSFDVSCHAYARNKDGFLLKHPKATCPGAPIQWINEPDEEPSSLLCAEGTCSDCDATRAQYKLVTKRREEFTQRYADIKAEEIWL